MSRPIALITGASAGIGKAIAAELSSTHHVLVGGRDSARVAEVVASLESAEPLIVDLNDASAAAAAVANIQRLDVLVHSAGVVAYGPLEATTAAQWEQVLGLNVVAPAILTGKLLPALRSASGTVVFINSGAGLRANPGWSVYAASKFALTAVADSLRAEESGRVTVISVHPGRVATDMQVELNQLEGRPYDPAQYLEPAQVARTVALALNLAPNASLDTIRITGHL